MTNLTPRETGRYRLKPITIGHLWWKKTVLVHQTEFIGNVPAYGGPIVDIYTKRWWVNTKPEWRMEIKTPASEDPIAKMHLEEG